MAKDGIIHFVGFITRMEPEDFIVDWEQHARALKNGNDSMVLQQLDEITGKSRFKYLSRHILSGSSIRFTFLQGRSSERFPEKQVKVVQAGGYSCVQSKGPSTVRPHDVTILVFVSPRKMDTGFSRQLTCKTMNVYEAYYENCLYSSILEFIVPEKEAPGILEELKQVEEIEVSVYRDCLVPHI